VDLVLNLVMASGDEMKSLCGLVVPGGAVLSTATPAIGDPDREVRALGMQLRADGNQLAALAAQVDAGEIRVEPSATYSLADAAKVHEEYSAGNLHGKVVLTTAADRN
jgi:NADPH:quinone reductase-like Zn-dependent oxidoreductase